MSRVSKKLYNICVQILEIKNKIIIKIKGLFFLLYFRKLQKIGRPLTQVTP